MSLARNTSTKSENGGATDRAEAVSKRRAQHCLPDSSARCVLNAAMSAVLASRTDGPSICSLKSARIPSTVGRSRVAITYWACSLVAGLSFRSSKASREESGKPVVRRVKLLDQAVRDSLVGSHEGISRATLRSSGPGAASEEELDKTRLDGCANCEEGRGVP